MRTLKGTECMIDVYRMSARARKNIAIRNS